MPTGIRDVSPVPARNDYNMNQFGWSLRHCRRAVGWSVAQFAALCGIPKATLIQYEVGDMPYIESGHLERFVDALAGRRTLPGHRARGL